ncbi:MAG: hypothetical protein IM613_12950 [Cytophagales bacterium]|nr:hypothetical protein [Cytophagales bacterium]
MAVTKYKPITDDALSRFFSIVQQLDIPSDNYSVQPTTTTVLVNDSTPVDMEDLGFTAMYDYNWEMRGIDDIVLTESSGNQVLLEGYMALQFLQELNKSMATCECPSIEYPTLQHFYNDFIKSYFN